MCELAAAAGTGTLLVEPTPTADASSGTSPAGEPSCMNGMALCYLIFWQLRFMSAHQFS